MLGYRETSRLLLIFVTFSVFLTFTGCSPIYNAEDADPRIMRYDSSPDSNQLPLDKRGMMRFGKRAVMRFGKRAVMRFGKRSVFRLG